MFMGLGISGIKIDKKFYSFADIDETISFMVSDAIDEIESGNMTDTDKAEFMKIYYYWYGEQYEYKA